MTREELTTTFDYQVRRLQEIDSKAIEILKANLLLIGIVVTGGSVLVGTDLAVGAFINPFTLTGGLLLLISTGLASVTYTASNLRGGLETDAVEAAIEIDAAEQAGGAGTSTFEVRLLRSYARWIDYNSRMIAVNDVLVTVTVLLVFVAFVYVAAGVVIAALTPSVTVIAASYLILTMFLGSYIWIAYHMDHIGPEPDLQAETFPGIRLSKGTNRDTAFATLRAMVGRSPPDWQPPPMSDEVTK